MEELLLAKKLKQEIKSLLAIAKRSNDLNILRKVKTIQKLNQDMLKIFVEKKIKNNP